MSRKPQFWKLCFRVSVLLSILFVASLAPYLTSPTELVRLRNSLLYDPLPADASWTPTNPPPGYLVESASAPPSFVQIVEANHLVVPGDDWATALQIGRHLLQGKVAHRSNSGAIQKGLFETYQRITENGDGYCGDFVDGFTALATTAGLFARAWAFSFDGFGGHGHIFNEVWDRQAGAWRMIDVFNNYYVVDKDERPLSALEFRERLLRDEPIAWRAVEPAARPGYKYPEKAVDYYRRGAHQWYLWWGNNAFEYDQHSIVKGFSRVSRSLAQLSAIVVGVHPPIRVLTEPENLAMQAQLRRVAVHLVTVILSVALLTVLALVSVRKMRLAGGATDASAIYPNGSAP